MKERPILFSAPMIRAIFTGQKRQTRRICKPALFPGNEWAAAVYPAQSGWIAWAPKDYPDLATFTKEHYVEGFPCPYGKTGDWLWVRETFTYHFGQLLYRADCSPGSYEYGAKGWKPAIHMPRAVSRITLTITDVRVERLQEISEADCCAELGAPLTWPGPGPAPYERSMRAAFAGMWNIINEKRGYSWESNPWVWTISFEQVA